VRESTTPTSLAVPSEASLADMVVANATEAPDHVQFRRRVGDTWVPVTTKAFSTDVQLTAAGLVARGVNAGDRVAVMSRTRYEWSVADFAIWTVGAVTVPIYETSSAEQVEWILSDSAAVLVIAETAAMVDTIAAVRSQCPLLHTVVGIEDGDFDALATAGEAVPQSELSQRRAGVGKTSTATLVYTSGTTGRPKGVELTHGNFLFGVLVLTEDLATMFDPDNGSTLMFLPLAHIFGRLVQVGCVASRVCMGHSHDVKNLLGDLAVFQPTFLLSVPRVFEKVYNSAKAKAHADGKGKVFDHAERIAITYSEALDTPGGPGLALRAKHAVADRLVYTRLRAALGGRITTCVSGGAPLGARLGHFFRGAGVNILEGYGLTETSAGHTINLPGHQVIGSVGRALPGMSVRIADDGEVLLKGANVFTGYWHNDEATAEALTGDGWFHTGDLGALDEQGFLTITGRKKEIIVTAGGKNVAPAVLEDRIRAHPLVSQCMVIGDKQPFIACLVTIDAEVLPGWLAGKGRPADTALASLLDDAELAAAVQVAIDDANRAVSRAEAIRSFRILPHDFTIEGGELTPTLKVKRNVVAQHYAQVIAEIYSGTGTD
jgi:long-chain acyl-CoA synthetase